MSDENTQSTENATDDAGKETPPATEPQDVASLPKWAQDLIAGVRKEAAGHRTKAKDLESASKSQLEAIAKALGLKSDEADPAKLQEALGKSHAELRQSRVELRVRAMAGKHGADADALLDSRSFNSAVADLDPTSADFESSVADAIKAAVEGNPKLKVVQVATKGGTDIKGSGGAQAPTFTRAQLRDPVFYREHEKDILAAQRDGRISG